MSECKNCGLLIGTGSMSTTLPLCKCQWGRLSHIPEQLDKYRQREAELTSLRAFKQKVMELEPVGAWSVWDHHRNKIHWFSYVEADCHNYISAAPIPEWLDVRPMFDLKGIKDDINR